MLSLLPDRLLLTAPEEQALAERIHRRDRTARDELVLRNLRLVPPIAARFGGLGLEREDLCQEGYIGLMQAVRRYDGGRGTRFSTYATWWIRQAIQRAVETHGRAVRVPSYQQVGARRATLASRFPATRPVISLDLPAMTVGDPGGRREVTPTIGDNLIDDGPSVEEQALEEIDSEEASEQLTDLVAAAHLSDRERDILLARSRGDTLREIAGCLGCSRERVRQIEDRALSRLREEAESWPVQSSIGRRLAEG